MLTSGPKVTLAAKAQLVRYGTAPNPASVQAEAQVSHQTAAMASVVLQYAPELADSVLSGAL
jgi:hypothetical protein